MVQALRQAAGGAQGATATGAEPRILRDRTLPRPNARGLMGFGARWALNVNHQIRYYHSVMPPPAEPPSQPGSAPVTAGTFRCFSAAEETLHPDALSTLQRAKLTAMLEDVLASNA